MRKEFETVINDCRVYSKSKNNNYQIDKVVILWAVDVYFSLSRVEFGNPIILEVDGFVTDFEDESVNIRISDFDIDDSTVEMMGGSLDVLEVVVNVDEKIVELI